MYNFSTLLTLASVATTALATSSEPKHYRLKTEVKPHQRGKGAYNDLYLTAYHTGAGLNDATFVKNSSNAAVGYLNSTSTSTAKVPGNVQSFDLSNSDTPWSVEIAYSAVPYSGWQPVRINIGDGGSTSSETHGFFINSTGLQWNSAPGTEPSGDQFGGWVVCDWWHNVPQLFFRLAGYNYPLPKSCADIYLKPEYVAA